MRLLCNGVALDLLSGAALSFKKSNPLFAFDALACERTQSFDIPATPHNERVMQLAKLPAFRGEGMRRRFDAELQDGIVVKHGYLYVDSFTRGTYKATFVTGELFGLQNIKNAGKISDIIDTNVYASWSGERSADLEPTLYDPVSYKTPTNRPYPSVNIGMLLELAMETIGARMQTVNHNTRIVPDAPKPYKERERAIVSLYSGTPYVNALDLAALDNILFVNQEVEVASIQNDSEVIYRVVRYWARQHMQITFPKDMSDNWFLCDLKQGEGNLYGNFIGGYSFYYEMRAGDIRGTLHKVGEPLAGRTIDIEDNQVFMLVHCEDFKYEIDSSSRLTQGWIFDRFCYLVNTNQSVMLKGVDLVPGDYVFLRDNLPEMTVTELLKVYAAINGRVLNYTDAEGIAFEDVDTKDWETETLRDVISIESVSRKFGDFARRNIVRYESASNVPESQRIAVEYVVDNDNLPEQKDLQVIPFSEGAIAMSEGKEVVYIGEETDKSTLIAHTEDGTTYAERVYLNEVPGMQTLCDASTSVNIKVRMTLAQYERMSAKTAILCNGTRYVWTEATWSKEVATLKLSKIL